MQYPKCATEHMAASAYTWFPRAKNVWPRSKGNRMRKQYDTTSTQDVPQFWKVFNGLKLSRSPKYLWEGLCGACSLWLEHSIENRTTEFRLHSSRRLGPEKKIHPTFQSFSELPEAAWWQRDNVGGGPCFPSLCCWAVLSLSACWEYRLLPGFSQGSLKALHSVFFFFKAIWIWVL